MYTIEGEQYGIVRFTPSVGTVLFEQEKLTSKVTSNPIEDGSTIEDHVAIEPAKFTISGEIVGGPDAAHTLRHMWHNRDICTYTGRFRREYLVISALDLEANPENRTGCSFKLTFTQVSIISGINTDYGASMTNSDKKKKKKKKNKKSMNVDGTQNAGQQSIQTETVSATMYADYLADAADKPDPSSAPTTRTSPAYSGLL